MESINPTKPPLALKGGNPSKEKKMFGTKADKYSLHKFVTKVAKFVSPKKIPSSAALSADYAVSSIKSTQYAVQALDKADKSQGARAALKITNAATSALRGASYASYTVAQPFALIDVLKQPLARSSSLAGRVSAGFNSLAAHLGNIATFFFVMATGYKIYETSQWCQLTQKELYQKIKPPTITEVPIKYKDDGDSLKKLVYDYFEDKVQDVLKKGKKAGLEAKLKDRQELERIINQKIDDLLTQDSGFIQDKKAWQECIDHREQNKVEAFGLYIRVMLARQSHRQEMKRVFGKEGLKIIRRMELGKTENPKLYAKAMTICRQRLMLDTLNFVLGIGVMSLMVFSASAVLALPLLVKISKSSVNLEYFTFAMKALVIGAIVLTPYGITALTVFSIGFFVYNITQLGLSYVPFMQSKEFENYTRYDKLLIKINIALSVLSFITTGFIGMSTGVSFLTTTALASTQLPWLGLNAYGLSQIWKKEEERKQALQDAINQVLDQEAMNELIQKYGFDVVCQALAKAPKGSEILKKILSQDADRQMPDAFEDLLKEFKKDKKEKDALALQAEVKEQYAALKREGLIIQSQ